jgi:hypothetical protein
MAGVYAGRRASEVGRLQMRDYDPETEPINIHRIKGPRDGDAQPRGDPRAARLAQDPRTVPGTASAC